MVFEGILLKMHSIRGDVVEYSLPVGTGLVRLNDLIGHKIRIAFLKEIHCIRCGRLTRKSFAQGYCYPCFMNAPETSECVLHPELCRAHEGLSRDMEWSKEHCLQDHIVYLALTSGLKVGVTRLSQIPTRWIDQGARRAIRLAKTPNRYMAGVIEAGLKKHVYDKTNWRYMLTHQDPQDQDLIAEKKRIKEFLNKAMITYYLDDDEIVEISYPVLSYPVKVRSIDLDKTTEVEGILTGIKGQYMIFEDGSVLNVRKHGGYMVRFMVR